MPQEVEVGDIGFLEPAPARRAEPKKPSQPQINEAPLLTEAQRKKIFASARQMGYEDDEIRAILRDKWGIENTKELTKAQASELIGMIERGEGIPAKAE
jgi:arylsulfatase A-like enzyme